MGNFSFLCSCSTLALYLAIKCFSWMAALFCFALCPSYEKSMTSLSVCVGCGKHRVQCPCLLMRLHCCSSSLFPLFWARFSNYSISSNPFSILWKFFSTSMKRPVTFRKLKHDYISVKKNGIVGQRTCFVSLRTWVQAPTHPQMPGSEAFTFNLNIWEVWTRGYLGIASQS